MLGLRASVGLLALRKKHAVESIDAACGKALTVEAFRLRDVRSMLTAEWEQPEFTFMEKHPLIRDIEEYALTGQRGRTPFEKEMK